MDFPTELIPDEETRAGRIMAAGDIRVTITVPSSDFTVTVRFKALFDNRYNAVKRNRPKPESDRNWVRVPLVDATHVFIEVPNVKGEYPEKVGTFYPRTGKFFSDVHTDPETLYAATNAAAWLTGRDFDPVLKYAEEPYCGVCGRSLPPNDPESNIRGICPECQPQQHSKQLRFPSKTPESSPFMVNKILTEIETLNEIDQTHIYHELKVRLT